MVSEWYYVQGDQEITRLIMVLLGQCDPVTQLSKNSPPAARRIVLQSIEPFKQLVHSRTVAPPAVDAPKARTGHATHALNRVLLDPVVTRNPSSPEVTGG